MGYDSARAQTHTHTLAKHWTWGALAAIVAVRLAGGLANWLQLDWAPNPRFGARGVGELRPKKRSMRVH